jgi:hypothetical protein
MNNTDIIDRTISFVKEKLKHAEGGRLVSYRKSL